MTLVSRAFGSDPLFGANQIAMIGRQGTRKTTLLRAYAELGLKQKHTVIWRARPSHDQWHLIPTHPRIIVPEGVAYRFMETPQIGMSAKEREFSLIEYDETDQIPGLLQEGGLNILVEPDLPKPWISLWWLYILRLLGTRKKHEWIRICFDEILDVLPSSAVLKDDAYVRIMPELARSFYDFRRQNIEILMVGHRSGDLHYDIRGAFTGIIYLPGAQQISGWKVNDRALRSLKSGHAIVELPGIFGDEILQIPANRQPTSKISFTSSGQWTLDAAFKDFSKNILDYKIFKKYRYWSERKARKEQKKPEVDTEKIEGISPLDSFKKTHVRGKKAVLPSGGGRKGGAKSKKNKEEKHEQKRKKDKETEEREQEPEASD